jgi:ribosome production factor 2
MSHQNESDDEINIPRQPKTKKGRKIIENRKGKVEEDPRQTLFIRGPKSSDNVRLFMNEMVIISFKLYFDSIE